MTDAIWSLGAGLLFAVGLAISGMTLPSKVSGFLDFAGKWDPSLALVMGGAVGVYALAHQIERRRAKPVFGAAFPEKPSSSVDARVLGGAALFGIGWGLSGFCPGPAVVSFGAGAIGAVWFLPAMVVGMLVYRLIERPDPQSEQCGYGGEGI